MTATAQVSRNGKWILAIAIAQLISCQPATRLSSSTENIRASTEAGGPFVYVSNEESTEISMIDASTDAVVANIFVGKRPRGIKVSPDGKSLFVALSGSPMAPPGTDQSKVPPADRAADGIAVVDLALRRLVRTLATGEDPESFDFTADGKSLYVSNEDAGTVTVMSLQSERVTAVIPVGGEPEGVCLRPDGKVVYVTSEADNQVAAIDTETNRVIAKIQTAARPRGIAFTPDGARAYVTAEQAGVVTVIDARKHAALVEIAIEAKGAKPMGIVMSSDGRTAYVTCGRGGMIAILDVVHNRVLKTVPEIGVRPWGIGLSPDGRKLYTANGPSNDVSVIDVASGAVLKRIPVGKSPWGIAISK